MRGGRAATRWWARAVAVAVAQSPTLEATLPDIPEANAPQITLHALPDRTGARPATAEPLKTGWDEALWRGYPHG